MEERIKLRNETIVKTNQEYLKVKNQVSKEQMLILRQQEMYEKIKEERLLALKERYKLNHEDLKQHEQLILQRAQERSSNTRILKNFSVLNVHKSSKLEQSDLTQEKSTAGNDDATKGGFEGHDEMNHSLDLNRGST